MKKKDYALLSIIILILLTFFIIRFSAGRTAGEYVKITENGHVISTYPLNEDNTVALTHNTVMIKDGRAYMSDADCPDGLCVDQGDISGAGEVIACLPNRVTVEIISDTHASGDRSYMNDPIVYSGIHFDTLVNVSVYELADPVLASDDTSGASSDRAPADAFTDSADVCDAIRAECEKMELICSRTNESSELYLLNHDLISENKTIEYEGCEITAYKVSEPLYDMISEGVKYGDLTDGKFDIAIAPLAELWDFKSGTKIIPDKSAIDNALPHLSYKNIILLDDNYVAFADEDCMIDLGGLAKGYIGNHLRDMLRDKGVTSAVISLGGNIVTIGDKAGAPFNVGIHKPFGAGSEMALTLKVKDKCVITSGTYERYFEKDGRLYHHILDPSTGYPYDTDLSSASVICDSSLEGDILSTVLISEGSDAAIAHADRLLDSGIRVILINSDAEIIYDNHEED